MEIKTETSPGIHVRAIVADEEWAASWGSKSGRRDWARADREGLRRLCPQCGKRKDTGCFSSHRTLAKPVGPFKICNVCRVGNESV